MQGFGLKIKDAIDTFAAKNYTIPQHLQCDKTDAISALGALRNQFADLQTHYTLNNQMLADMIGRTKDALNDLKHTIDQMHQEPHTTFEIEKVDGEMLAKLLVIQQGTNILKSTASGLKSISDMERQPQGNTALAAKVKASHTLATQLSRDFDHMYRIISSATPGNLGS